MKKCRSFSILSSCISCFIATSIFRLIISFRNLIMGNTPSCFYEKVNDDGSVSFVSSSPSPGTYNTPAAATGGDMTHHLGPLVGAQEELNFRSRRPNDSDEDDSSLTLSECATNEEAEEVIAVIEKNFFTACDIVNERQHHNIKHQPSLSSLVAAELDLNCCDEKSAMDSKPENVLSPSYKRGTLSHSPLQSFDREESSPTRKLVDDMYRAVKNDNIEAIISVATKSVTGCNVLRDMRFANQLTLLHISVIHARFEIAVYMIETIHIDINAKDNTGRTALDWANLCGDFMMRKLLLSAQMLNSRESSNDAVEVTRESQDGKESKSVDSVDPKGVYKHLNDEGSKDSKTNTSLPLRQLDSGEPIGIDDVGAHKSTAILARSFRKAASQALRVVGLKKPKRVSLDLSA